MYVCECVYLCVPLICIIQLFHFIGKIVCKLFGFCCILLKLVIVVFFSSLLSTFFFLPLFARYTETTSHVVVAEIMRQQDIKQKNIIQ